MEKKKNIELIFSTIRKKKNICELFLENNNLGKGNQKNIKVISSTIQHLPAGTTKNSAL